MKWFLDDAEITEESCAHFSQLVEFNRLLKQAFVLGLLSHFTDDSSGVPCKLIYDSRLERRGERVRQSTAALTLEQRVTIRTGALSGNARTTLSLWPRCHATPSLSSHVSCLHFCICISNSIKMLNK